MPDPLTLSQAEIDQYSIIHHIRTNLANLNWTTVTVSDVSDGWPVYEELQVPGVYVLVEQSTAMQPFELGSHAKARRVFVHIFGQNDAQRTRLADTIEDIIRDIIPIYNYVDGNEDSPDISDYFETDEVGWRKLIQTRNTPDKERFRSVVTARLRRVVA